MPTLNYTTTVPVSRTLSEIQAMLVKHGADAVVSRYSAGEIVGLSFTLPTPHGQRAFTLPVDVPAVHRVLVKQLGSDRKGSSEEQAARVAWRVLKDWLAAQLAIIEAQMATLDQVMLPYLHVDGELTMYEAFRENEHRALTA
jgi:molybdopterin-guanine dinucleotide biosynthesis protein A